MASLRRGVARRRSLMITVRLLLLNQVVQIIFSNHPFFRLFSTPSLFKKKKKHFEMAYHNEIWKNHHKLLISKKQLNNIHQGLAH